MDLPHLLYLLICWWAASDFEFGIITDNTAHSCMYLCRNMYFIVFCVILQSNWQIICRCMLSFSRNCQTVVQSSWAFFIPTYNLIIPVYMGRNGSSAGNFHLLKVQFDLSLNLPNSTTLTLTTLLFGNLVRNKSCISRSLGNWVWMLIFSGLALPYQLPDKEFACDSLFNCLRTQ